MRVHIFAKFVGHVTMTTPPFQKKFSSCHVRTVVMNTPVKFEVHSFNRFGAYAFNAPKLRGQVTVVAPPFLNIFKG